MNLKVTMEGSKGSRFMITAYEYKENAPAWLELMHDTLKATYTNG